jgi:hypothetical protein
MDNVGIFHGHLEYLTVIWYILWPFGIFCGHLVHIFPFWYVVPRKIWQPSTGVEERKKNCLDFRKGNFAVKAYNEISCFFVT